MNYRPLALTSAFVLALASCEQKPATSATPAPVPATAPTPAAPEAAAPAEAMPAPAPTPAPAPAVADADPKAAFVAALNSLADDVAEVEKASGGNPMEMMKKLPAILAKLQAVPTAGLPDEVSTSFARLQKNALDTAEVMKSIPTDLPSDPVEIEAYMKEHPETMAALMGIQGKMDPIQKEGELARNELKAAAQKHGLDIAKFLKAGEKEAAAE